ncbi:hypothetical protein EYZ11_005681 [Aspergillus tanneri]|uniref:ABC transporter domain-containing protein n=1 Tax=Aspergillus tanneri TaxID=1220188 RepID=A0A4S3JHY1_9EURO|nr:hypothetical protein EYZ11_005681 [Aspergillus tanneri]
MSVFGGIPPLDDPRHAGARPDHESIGQYETDTAPSRTNMDERHDSEKEEGMEEEVEQMVRQLTLQSTHFSTSGANNPFFEENKESTWHPDSPFFKIKDWIRSLLAAQSRNPSRFRQRSAGVAFKNLYVHGFGSPTDYQKDVLNSILGSGGLLRRIIGSGFQKVQILNDFNGLIRSGEMLLVLGRPGSGCSTFLKTIAGEMNGIYVHEDSYMNYQGISSDDMQGKFRGEALFSAETDVHFPQLTVGDTLTFAAQARAPRNDFVRGVSGGERKRVSIAEAILSGAPLQCWDNSTRGLDSANALEFCKNLQLMSNYAGTTPCVAIYQASQKAYNVFDKVVVLYEGHQIYFGPTNEARQFFTDMGFDCPQRQTTADFLTSLTSPTERRVKAGYESKVPRTPVEFATRWRNSTEFAMLMREIDEFDKEFPIGGESYTAFGEARQLMKSKQQLVALAFQQVLFGLFPL